MDIELSLDMAHPRAQALLADDWYWDPTNETAPFGSDDGSDAAYGFIEWREHNPGTSPVAYLAELFEEWGYPPFDLHTTDIATIEAYSATSSVGTRMVNGIDSAVVAVACAQLATEGRINRDICTLAVLALRREELPHLLALFTEGYRIERQHGLAALLRVLKEAEE